MILASTFMKMVNMRVGFTVRHARSSVVLSRFRFAGLVRLASTLFLVHITVLLGFASSAFKCMRIRYTASIFVRVVTVMRMIVMKMSVSVMRILPAELSCVVSAFVISISVMSRGILIVMRHTTNSNTLIYRRLLRGLAASSFVAVVLGCRCGRRRLRSFSGPVSLADVLLLCRGGGTL